MKMNERDVIKIKELSLKYNISYEETKKIVNSQYEFTREKIKNIDFKENLTEKEFLNLKTNFNIPGIGKLSASYYLYKRINERKNIKKNE